MKFTKQIHLFEIQKIPVTMHWCSASLCILTPLLGFFAQSISLRIQVGLSGLTIFLSIYSLIFVHELGHALTARKMGFEVYAIHIKIFSGACLYNETDMSIFENSTVAWGGPIAREHSKNVGPTKRWCENT